MVPVGRTPNEDCLIGALNKNLCAKLNLIRGISTQKGNSTIDLMCEQRQSDSPLVETIWCSQSDHAHAFISMAATDYGIVVTKYRDRTTLTVRGPETRATSALTHEYAEYIGINFKSGVFMPDFLPAIVIDRHDIDLPEATSKSFWLHGSIWQLPNFENADTFVNRLVRDGLLVLDPVVGDLLHKAPIDISTRTAQRHFLRATGLTYRAFGQIERARYAASLLKQGVSILDTVYQAGYFDQPHLTRSLKHFIGLTPAQMAHPQRSERLSFLYKTTPLILDYATDI